MKMIFSAFVIAVCCMFMAMPAQAQLLKWGVKGGVNMTKIDWDAVTLQQLSARFYNTPFELGSSK